MGLRVRIGVAGALVVCLALITMPALAQQTLTQDQAKKLCDRYLEARNTANLALLDDVFEPNVVVHEVGKEFIALDSLKVYYTRSHTAFPDMKFTFDKIMVSGDCMTVFWTITGTNSGPLDQMPPTGKSVRFSGIAVDRVAGGKIVEEWVSFNLLDLLTQLGFTLTPPVMEQK